MMIRRRDTGPLCIMPAVAPTRPSAFCSRQECAADEATTGHAEARAARVAELRARIAAGSYHVPDAELARCLLLSGEPRLSDYECRG